MFYTVGGTATPGLEYTGIGTTRTTRQVTFAAGSSRATVTVVPIADSTLEANETVSLTLASGAGYTIGTRTAVTGTINNDDFTLYNSATGRPNDQGWLLFGGLGGSQSRSTNGTTLTSSINGAAGYSNHAIFTPTLFNSAAEAVTPFKRSAKGLTPPPSSPPLTACGSWIRPTPSG